MTTRLRPLREAPAPPPCSWRLTGVDGWTMAARTWTRPRSLGQQPLVCVHGLVVSSRYMVPMTELLARNRDVFAPDLPGFGASDKPDRTLGVGELADALHGWLTAMALGPVTLFGNSFGCQVAARVAAEHPESVHSLVLAAPTFEPSTRSVPVQLRRWVLEQSTHSLALRRIMLHDYRLAGFPRAIRTFRAALADRIEVSLPRVEAPALVIRGTGDPIVSEGWARRAADLLPDGSLTTLPGATHAINHEMPLQTARVTEHFLATVRKG
jgi:2-hydroxy-6-oxonona-2,4-dienedioate hydrolase